LATFSIRIVLGCAEHGLDIASDSADINRPKWRIQDAEVRADTLRHRVDRFMASL
jgi:hypothetical protein